MADFSIFQDGGRPPFWIFKISKFKFLTFGTSRRANLRHNAKFRANRLKLCGDMAIFSVFQDGGCPPPYICYTPV